MDSQLILNSSNQRTTATVQGKTVNDLDAAPLGKTAGGEVGEKVIVIGGASGSTSPAGSTVTPNFALLGASESQVIPAGAKGWSFAVLTGTATVGGEALIPAGLGDADPNTLTSSLTITTAAASSAYVRWNT